MSREKTEESMHEREGVRAIVVHMTSIQKGTIRVRSGTAFCDL